MRILQKEIDLREETRQAEQIRRAAPTETHVEQTRRLAATQGDLAHRVTDVTQAIRELEDGESLFEVEISVLTRVEQVMGEAQRYLTLGDTGPNTVAAETEAIELLLQAKRIDPKGGGGGRSSPGGGGDGETDVPALALLGSGAEYHSQETARAVGQTTGNSGLSLPAEFRTGLDAFFDALEKGQMANGESGQ